MATSRKSITSVGKRKSSMEKRVSIVSIEKDKDETNKKRVSMVNSFCIMDNTIMSFRLIPFVLLLTKKNFNFV